MYDIAHINGCDEGKMAALALLELPAFVIVDLDT